MTGGRITGGLNPEQLRAVETLRGPVCILAGAGSGKTTTIARLETTEEPSSVGIAREYSRLLADADLEKLPPKTRKRAIELGEKIAAMLKLPSQLAKQGDILEAP